MPERPTRILKHSSSSQSSRPFLKTTENALYINVRVVPRAKRDEVSLADSTEALKIRLTKAPVDGEANKALIKLLAKLFNIKKSSITITSGKKSRDKRVKIEEVEAQEIEKLLKGEIKAV